MKPYGQGPPHSTDGSQSGWNSPAPPETGVEESMWQLGLGGGGSGRENSYPERPSEADCVYYMRTGFCGYGARCRFNHPRDRSSVSGVVRTGGELPERVGQPVCQYFLRTGTCKYGASCKYHHPRYGGESESPVALNFYGYPLRPGEKECSYYVKTGQCKFGVTCKFHHPLPAGISVPATAPTFYPTVQPASVPPQYGIASWQVARPPVVPSSYVQGPYGPVLLPPGMVQVPGWSPFPPIVSPVASPGTQHATGTSSLYGSTHQLSPSAPAYVGPISSSSFAAGPSSSSQKEHIFPQRPGQPECQFYMRTGDCKYGSSCRYHHPPEWSMPKITCALSPLGLPLRPGTPICTFYAQHGVCKFGLTCKFDHPMETPSYSPSASSLADMPVVPYTVGSSMVTLVPSTSSSELRPEFAAGSSKDSYPVKKTSLENMPSISVGTILSKGSGSVPQSRIQLSTQSSSTSSGSRSFGRGGVSS